MVGDKSTGSLDELVVAVELRLGEHAAVQLTDVLDVDALDVTRQRRYPRLQHRLQRHLDVRYVTCRPHTDRHTPCCSVAK